MKTEQTFMQEKDFHSPFGQGNDCCCHKRISTIPSYFTAVGVQLTSSPLLVTGDTERKDCVQPDQQGCLLLWIW